MTDSQTPNMRALIAGLGDQMKEALLAPISPDPASKLSFQGVAILGMGGSGIGGAIMSDLLRSSSAIPVVAVSDQVLPGWVDKHCLVVASSYSGNTEETLACLEEAVKRGCTMAAVTSGGTLLRRAEEAGWPVVQMPSGHPPRSQFGRSFLGLARVLRSFGVLTEVDWQALVDAVNGLDAESAEFRGEQLAMAVEGKRICLYADTPWRGLATRWRQQLNENSKLLANVEVFPEMNHNELVGWESGDESWIAVMIRTENDHPRSVLRMDITAEVFQGQGADVVMLEPDGESTWMQLLDAVWVGDWMSLVLAERAEVDPVDIRFIDHLKHTLSQHP